MPFADLGFARVDHHRPLRQGFPEAVYAPGKTPAQCAAIVAELAAGPTAGPVLLTRAGEDVAAAALARTPGGRYDPVARLAVWNPLPRRTGSAVVACAGTADLPVAEEAATTLAALGWPPARLTDVGVAGIHRLLAEEPVLQAADVIVVVAGMEGALASAVGGLAAAPVISVPTSAGYGSSLEGVTALLAMLASCAPGVAVMGIDNGYGAACAAARILGALERARTGDRP
ncbi:MAG TPA: nickel pincer cofactor biosynthesis protein LarB [Acidimicrobiia bacterium]|nr:nickel pincer cofactor biosynthesis protein LarB [Acidimicrobiia bacterium]